MEHRIWRIDIEGGGGVISWQEVEMKEFFVLRRRIWTLVCLPFVHLKKFSGTHRSGIHHLESYVCFTVTAVYCAKREIPTDD
jgi:hypothetical protein